MLDDAVWPGCWLGAAQGGGGVRFGWLWCVGQECRGEHKTGQNGRHQPRVKFPSARQLGFAWITVDQSGGGGAMVAKEDGGGGADIGVFHTPKHCYKGYFSFFATSLCTNGERFASTLLPCPPPTPRCFFFIVFFLFYFFFRLLFICSIDFCITKRWGFREIQFSSPWPSEDLMADPVL